MIRALVVSSSALLRTGLESLVEIAGAVPDAAGAAALAAELDPDLIIIDWDSDQAAEVMELASEGAPILVLSSDPRPPWSNEALRAGVRGIVPRDSSTEEIAAAIQAAAAGLIVLHPQSVETAALHAAPPDPLEPLSPREIDVLRLIGEGMSNKAIAWRLHISEHTVKFHVNSILSKMNAGSRTEAVMLGLRRGLIPL